MSLEATLIATIAQVASMAASADRHWTDSGPFVAPHLALVPGSGNPGPIPPVAVHPPATSYWSRRHIRKAADDAIALTDDEFDEQDSASASEYKASKAKWQDATR